MHLQKDAGLWQEEKEEEEGHNNGRGLSLQRRRDEGGVKCIEWLRPVCAAAIGQLVFMLDPEKFKA